MQGQVVSTRHNTPEGFILQTAVR